MILEIDTENSILRQKVIPVSKAQYLFSFFVCAFFYIVFAIATYGLIKQSNFKSSFLLILILSFISAIALVDIRYRITLMDKMTRAKGLSILKNKMIVKQIIKDNNWDILKGEGDLIIIKATPKFSHERQVTIIFDKGDILINVFSFGKNNFKTSIYFYQDKLTLKSFLNDFNKAMKNVA